MGDLTIRPVRPSEHELLGRLTLAAYLALGSPKLAPDDDYAHELLDVAARAAAADVLVAVDAGGAVVGGVTYVRDRTNPFAEFDGADEAGIRMLAVDPAHQGRGVGEALVRACVDRARADGRACIVLHTTDDMPAAQRLYDRLGFRRRPDRDVHLDVPVLHLLAFVLDLDAG